jgi:Protein of unknown function (DUF4232)
MKASTITGRRMLAASCLIPVAAFLVAACGSANTGASPTKTVTVTITPRPPASTPASAGTSQCTTADLRLTVGTSNGAAGTIYYPLDFTNASSSACTMYGYPGVAIVSSQGGNQIGAAAGRGTTAPALVMLEPDATAHATLAVSDVLIGDNCLGQQVQVSWVQVYPPDQYSALFAPLSRQGCANQSLVTMHVSTVTSGP